MEIKMGVSVDAGFKWFRIERQSEKCIYRVSDIYVDNGTGYLVCDDSIETQNKEDRCNDR
jgi:hypothetical protein